MRTGLRTDGPSQEVHGHVPSLPLRASSETGPIANALGFLGNRSRRFRSGLPRKPVPSLTLWASSETGPVADAQGLSAR